MGQEAREGVTAARESIAENLGCHPDEVFITSGGSDLTGQITLQCLEKDFDTVFRRFLELIQAPGYDSARLELARRTQRQRGPVAHCR